jgi:hypothetical protein
LFFLEKAVKMIIRVSVRDKVGKEFTVKEIKRVEQISEDDLRRIARACEDTIRRTITQKTAKGTGTLANHKAWTATKIPNGWGIGDIDTLDADVPYWNHIDKGSLGINANWQHYLPRGYWLNGRWVEDDAGFVGIMPNNPIPAINYISTTLQTMDSLIPILLKG